MKTKNLFTSLAAAVMLSAGLAGAAQTVRADDTTQAQATSQTSTNSDAKKGTISIKHRSVTATINSDKPKIYAVEKDSKSTKPTDSDYTKGQTIQVYFSTQATAQNGQSMTLYYIEDKTIDGKDSMVFIPSTDVTVSSTVPSLDEYQKQAETDAKAIQDAYNNRDLEYIVVTPKSKKGAKIYYAYKKTKKSKKVFFKASKKTIKKGKKFKSNMIVKNGKTRYIYIGKKRYVKQSAMKITSAKYAPVKLSDDLKNLIVEN